MRCHGPVASPLGPWSRLPTPSPSVIARRTLLVDLRQPSPNGGQTIEPSPPSLRAERTPRCRITAPVKGATLIGNGPETMQKVKMVGHDLALDQGVGICGKDGQSVPGGVGQPSLLIEGLTVGGTKA